MWNESQACLEGLKNEEALWNQDVKGISGNDITKIINQEAFKAASKLKQMDKMIMGETSMIS